MTTEQIKSIAFDLGWQVWTDEEQESVVFEFRHYTTHGQDYGFCTELTDNNTADFLDEVKQYCDNFDPDYEAFLWIGKDGHGKNGAPYHIKDIVDDMEEAKRMTEKLYETLKMKLV